MTQSEINNKSKILVRVMQKLPFIQKVVHIALTGHWTNINRVQFTFDNGKTIRVRGPEMFVEEVVGEHGGILQSNDWTEEIHKLLKG